MNQEKFKNIIIGFGKGGKTLAKMLAAKGESVAVIEESVNMYGGTCINIGCIPSKSLIVSGEKHLSFADAIKNKNILVQKLRDKNYHMIADEAAAKVITGKAKFISNYEIEISDKNQPAQIITGERIFINTGATPVFPNIEGLKESKKAITSKEIMELSELPQNLLIIGAGYIGLEFASMFHQFGSNITVMDIFDSFLPREDADVSSRIYQDMVDKGINFQLGVHINSIIDKDGKTTVNYTNKSGAQVITADKILVATGRKPNIDGLGLENTKIELTDKGAIKVNDNLQTSAANIWAIGDVHGGLQFTYTSLDDYRIIFNQLFGDKTRSLKNRGVVPYSVFISPALSSVGIKENEALSNGIAYKLFKLETNTIPKAHILQNPRGLFKALVDTETNIILGATIYAEESYELINLITLAMNAKIPYHILANQLYTHPTMSEALNDLFKE
ncbi:MAG: FAD-dependent oxidoreductase [Alphaproteobacteria bacterium]|nr:FAD-dependent oxidoreductase [Alphaproteobacteria bacterium]